MQELDPAAGPGSLEFDHKTVAFGDWPGNDKLNAEHLRNWQRECRFWFRRSACRKVARWRGYPSSANS
jgi:hypothetical protein